MTNKTKTRKSKHRGGQKVRARYERAIARAYANSVREIIVVPLNEQNQNLGSNSGNDPKETFEGFLQSMEEFLEIS